MRNYAILSDIEFENLAADLLAKDLGRPVERFARGKDGGIDVRWKAADGRLGLGQCKHYSRSTFSQLLAAARREVPKVRKLSPSKYLFYTSFDLSKSQKDQVFGVFKDWMSDADDVIGGSDIDGRLSLYSDVERRHVKLWISTGSQLFWANHSDLLHRSEALEQKVSRSIRTYVQSDSLVEAENLLDEHKVCLIAGEPGIGKTVLAHVLLARSMRQGFEPIEVSADIEEAWASLEGDRLQVFLYDDFLGQISFSERMVKNEDKRLVDFIDKISGMKSKRLIMTTREYILRDARRDYFRLNDMDERMHFVLQLDSYTRRNRAEILYNHLWNSDASLSCLAELSAGGWKRIVDHSAYSPRLIEYCTRGVFDLVSHGYLDRFEAALDHPEELWKNAYDRHLSAEQQAILLVLASMPIQVGVEDLCVAHESYCRIQNIPWTARSFRNCLEVLEQTFVKLSKRGDEPTVGFQSPSVAEFVLDVLRADRAALRVLIQSAAFFEQLTGLKAASTGGIRLGRSSDRVLLPSPLPLDPIRESFVEALARTFSGPSPERIREQDEVDTLYAPPVSMAERRMSYLLGQPGDWRPSDDWLRQSVRGLATQWLEGCGSRTVAVTMMSKLDAELVGVDEYDRLIDILEGWLENDLEETHQWVVYLDFLENFRDDAYPARLADDFEEFAKQELSRWHPSPPELDELISISQAYELDVLEEALHEKEREDELREEEMGSAVGERDQPIISEVGSSDSSIEELFGRFGAK